MSESFALFPSLPPELRLLIWQKLIEPRLISLQCQIQCAANDQPGTFLFHSFLNPPFSSDDDARTRTRSASAFDIRVHFAAAITLAPVPVLQVCRESRHFALRHGYRAWRLRDEFGHTRDVMWHVELDTISLATPHRPLIPRFYGELFRRQFPAEVAAVRRLAVPISTWRPKQREVAALGQCWAGYARLETMVVVMAGALKGFGAEAVVDHDTCRDLEAVEQGLDGLSERAPEGPWMVPAVVLVEYETDILRAEETDMHVTCNTCAKIHGGGRAADI
ncbi:hypothetical protein LZ554_005432 [Drepanopeziza brunnea f. sp. 'monogermtubi']|nr:hypothetical protein LZ554_005432 [Drepanopeziza brunnea f. sp. 'monogermtubi']